MMQTPKSELILNIGNTNLSYSLRSFKSPFQQILIYSALFNLIRAFVFLTKAVCTMTDDRSDYFRPGLWPRKREIKDARLSLVHTREFSHPPHWFALIRHVWSTVPANDRCAPSQSIKTSNGRAWSRDLSGNNIWILREAEQKQDKEQQATILTLARART